MANKRAKQIENGRNTGPSRTNVILDDATRDRAEALMAEERRSFNNLVSVLIDREWERLQKQKAVAA